MVFERHLPSPALRPYVTAFLVLESPEGMDNRVLPDTAVVLFFRYAGEVCIEGEALPAFGISGLRKSYRVIRYGRGAGNVLALLREGAARHFFEPPLHEFFGASYGLDGFVDRSSLDALEDRLGAAGSSAERVGIVESFLLSRLHQPKADPLVASAVSHIKATGGEARIDELLRSIPLSRDPFEKRFRQVVGATPKQFSTIVRFRNLIARRPVRGGLTGAALDSGYFDQAHFIKDFKVFTGVAPGVFFEEGVFW